MRKIIGFLGVLISILAFSFNRSLTGAVVGTSSVSNLSFVLTFALLIASFFVLTSKSLDAIMIPTGGHGERIKRALKDYDGKTPLLIAGMINRGEYGTNLKNTESSQIVKELRKNGIGYDQMILEGKSRDSLENFYNSLRKFEKLKKLAIATDDYQFERFKMYLERGKQTGEIPKDLEIEQLNTNKKYTLGERVYGILAYYKDLYRTRKGLKEGLKSSTTKGFIQKFKEFLWKP